MGIFGDSSRRERLKKELLKDCHGACLMSCRVRSPFSRIERKIVLSKQESCIELVVESFYPLDETKTFRAACAIAEDDCERLLQLVNATIGRVDEGFMVIPGCDGTVLELFLAGESEGYILSVTGVQFSDELSEALREIEQAFRNALEER